MSDQQAQERLTFDEWLARWEKEGNPRARVQVRPGEDRIESFAEVLWLWSWTVDQQKHNRPYPYERLIEATKDDLRAVARRLLAANDPLATRPVSSEENHAAVPTSTDGREHR